MPDVRAVLFDLDGTLVDTRRLYFASYVRGFEATLPEPPSFAEMMARHPSSERLFLLEWYGDELGDRIHRAVVDAYAELCETHLDGFFDGVEAMLAAVREAGLRTAIVTGKSRAAYEATTRHLPLPGFEVVVLEDDVPAAKPDPAGIERALVELGVEPAHAVYVGDTPMDAEAARRAGVQPASALWWRPLEDRARVAAGLEGVWALSHPAELLEHLARG